MVMATYSTYKARENVPAYPRDASFSSYLDSTERDFVRNLAASVHNQSYPARESSVKATVGNNRIARAELGVFGAERYFNEKLDNQRSTPTRKSRGIRKRHGYKREKIDDLLDKKSTKSTISTRSSLKSPTTQSLKSEGSYTSIHHLRDTPRSNIISNLQCKGTCFGKKSTYVINPQEMVKSPKLHRESKIPHQDHFAFPIIDTFSYNNLQDQPRESLEVFGFHHIAKKDIAQNIERKLSILAWDAIPNSQNNNQFQFQIPFPSVKNDYENDTRSEASSDLFEIENLSRIPPSQTSYATSEASIEWSVVTASTAEFSGVSEYRNDDKMARKFEFDSKKINGIEKIKVKKNPSSLSGGLLGCKSLKVVNVVGSLSNGNSKKIVEKGKFDHNRSQIIAHSTLSTRVELRSK